MLLFWSHPFEVSVFVYWSEVKKKSQLTVSKLTNPKTGALTYQHLGKTLISTIIIAIQSWHSHQEIKPRRFPEAILDKDGQIRPLETVSNSLNKPEEEDVCECH